MTVYNLIKMFAVKNNIKKFINNSLFMENIENIAYVFIAAMLVISLLPPLFEEMLFRGLLFNKYRKVSTILKAALLSGLF